MAVSVNIVVVCFALLFGGLTSCLNVERGFPFARRPVLAAPTVLRDARAPVAATIQQRLNHADPAETRTWQQRYFINEQFYVPGGPIFIMMGTEGPGSLDWLRGGQMMELALFYKAKAFSLEQRFHGQSIPTTDTTVENLYFSSPEQSIGDLAYLVTSIKISHPSAKVVVFGGSFSGTLAAWAIGKYPELIDGAVVSSAPLLSKVNFAEYLEEVGRVMALANEACVSDMNEAISAAKDLLYASETGGEDVAKLFNLCAPLDGTNRMDVYIFFLLFSEIYSSIVQSAHSLSSVQDYCDLITNPVYGSTPLERLSQITTTIFHPMGCVDVRYDTYLGPNQNTSWDSPAVVNRNFVFQECAFFGDFHTTGTPNQPFGDSFPAEVFIQLCSDYFSPSFDAASVENAVSETNEVYGGLQPTLRNAVFVHGSFDPWRVLGVLEDLSPTATAIVIGGASHVTDMGTGSVADSAELTAARLRIRDLVGLWISQ